MQVEVELFGILRVRAGTARTVAVGDCLGDVLADLAARFPDAKGLEVVEEMCHKGNALEVLLPVETALDDIPELAVTTEDAFRLTQGRSIVLLPRQVETLQARLSPSRIVSACYEKRIVALCEMRAGRLNPTRVFHNS